MGCLLPVLLHFRPTVRNGRCSHLRKHFQRVLPLSSSIYNPQPPPQAIEDDLARSTRIHTPRVMHRLLYALTQDRKITSVDPSLFLTTI